jgi:predicted metalloprotease with PDZ domain
LGETRKHGNHYTCGSLLALWTDLAVRDVDPNQDLFTYWGALIRRAHNEGGYDEEDYFAVLGELGVEDSVIATMQSFAREPQLAPAQFLRDALAPYGVQIRRNDARAPAKGLQAASAEVVKAILGADCRKSSGFYTTDAYLELAGLEQCTVARDGLRVSEIGSVPLDAPEFAAARYAARHCAEHDAITLGLHASSATIELACPDVMPNVPGWWVWG